MNQEPPFPEHGRRRVVIDRVSPQIEGGRYPIKRTVGERVVVEADIFADGHDSLSARLKFRPENSPDRSEAVMELVGNDRWRGEFTVTSPGLWYYTVEAWIDRFTSWRAAIRKKIQAGQEIIIDLKVGAALIEEAATRAPALGSEQLRQWAMELARAESITGGPILDRVMDKSLLDLVTRYAPRHFASICPCHFPVIVDPERARFSAWYEMFPRSASSEPGRHGTFQDCEDQLPRIAEMGFDVLYFPPIHPIGRAFRKGRNNQPRCQPDDPGSPWAIGSDEGGHKSVHPALGTLGDFRRLVTRARESEIEIALDIALQCSPDHPYVGEHPGWFRQRPDGSIQYAENPPKKYEDIYPFDFECEDWRGLWKELKSIFTFWVGQGVHIFRVDNPHTKSFAFWEWCLTELKRENPDLIFLAEAFTRPAVMYQLAKLGFTQSYNYFPWRNSKYELTTYLNELTHSDVAEFFRPNLWPNTPDILPQYLQTGSPAAFAVRLVLAATLGASYGIYGPAFELCESKPLKEGGEEYLNAEKFEIRQWAFASPQNLSDLIGRVNRIRRENPALRSNHRLEFHPVSNDSLIAYSKTTEDGTDTILTIVNLDPRYTQDGWIELPLEKFVAQPGQTYQMHDLLTGARFLWSGARNYVQLSPSYAPAHIFRLRHHVRTERDFDYFM